MRNRNSDVYKQYIALDDSQYVPHTILIDGARNVLAKKTGAMSKEMLVQFVSSHLK